MPPQQQSNFHSKMSLSSGYSPPLIAGHRFNHTSSFPCPQGILLLPSRVIAHPWSGIVWSSSVVLTARDPGLTRSGSWTWSSSLGPEGTFSLVANQIRDTDKRRSLSTTKIFSLSGAVAELICCLGERLNNVLIWHIDIQKSILGSINFDDFEQTDKLTKSYYNV